MSKLSLQDAPIGALPYTEWMMSHSCTGESEITVRCTGTSQMFDAGSWILATHQRGYRIRVKNGQNPATRKGPKDCSKFVLVRDLEASFYKSNSVKPPCRKLTMGEETRIA